MHVAACAAGREQMSRSYHSCGFRWGWTQRCSALLPAQGLKRCSATGQTQVFPPKHTCWASGKATGSCRLPSPLLVGFPILGQALRPLVSALLPRQVACGPSEALTASKNCYKNTPSWSYPNRALQIETFFTVMVYKFCKQSMELFHRVQVVCLSHWYTLVNGSINQQTVEPKVKLIQHCVWLLPDFCFGLPSPRHKNNKVSCCVV